jgi:hypothetical protein
VKRSGARQYIVIDILYCRVRGQEQHYRYLSSDTRGASPGSLNVLVCDRFLHEKKAGDTVVSEIQERVLNIRTDA